MGGKKTIHSMTGFGSSQAEVDGMLLEVEIKSVNSRFLDLSFRLPREYLPLELQLRERLSEHFSRGRVEFYVSRTPVSPERAAFRVNRNLFQAFWKEFLEIAGEVQLGDVETKRRIFTDLISRREVLDSAATSDVSETERNGLLKVLDEAAEKVLEMRESEGRQLKADLLARLASVERLAGEIEQYAVSAPGEFQTRLRDRLKRLLPEAGDVAVDESRLAVEIAILADRIDVTEELTRLKIHCSKFREGLEREADGRKSNFLLQEIARELNTIASKSQNVEVQQRVVEAKAECERVREQVQNIE